MAAVANGQPFDRDAAERVLRRAAALADDLDGGYERPGPLFTEQVLREAAAEVGLDGSAVARAAAEERLGMLAAPVRRGDRWVGPGTLMAARVADGAREDVLVRVDAWLRRVGAFQRRRHAASVVDYRRRTDPVAKVQRAAWAVTGREGLAGVKHLRVLAEPVDDGTTLIAFVVDTETQRTAALGGAGVIGSAGSIASVVAWSPIWTAVGLGASAIGALGVAGARRGLAGDLAVSLEGALRSAVTPSRVTAPPRVRRAS